MKIKKIIRNLLSVRIPSMLYRRHIYQYFRFNLQKVIDNITSIKTYWYFGKIIIKIEAHRPGILIGARGKTIKSLEEVLSRNLKKKVEIIPEECPVWLDLWIRKKLK